LERLVADVDGCESVSTSIIAADELAREACDDDWQACSVALLPDSLRWAARDRRWTSTFAVARLGSQPVGLLPMYRRKGPAFPARFLNPAEVAPEIFPGGVTANQYVLIGGMAEMVSGSAISCLLPADMTGTVKRNLVDEAYRWTAAHDFVGAALYVRQHELTAYVGDFGLGRCCQAVDEFSVLKLPGGGWEGYLASLDHKRRSVVKRDMKQLHQLDLVMRVSEATKVIEEAAPLVWNIKNRHGIPDHIVLVEDRLGDWAANPVGERVAFTVHDSAGQLLAVSFGCLYRNVLEMCEIGLLNDSTIRQLVYAEVLLYAPIRMASAAGGTEISLGLGSVIPKKLRGATVSKVWAVGE
jgi:hypothetical protein